MAHEHPTDWVTWDQETLDEAKEDYPEKYRGVTKVQDSVCATCDKVVRTRMEY